jgi:dihydrofolate reductase
MSRPTFSQLATARLNDQKCVVISRNIDNNSITISQQVEVTEGQRRIKVFLKNGIQIDSIEGLYNLRDAINTSIDELESLDAKETYMKNFKK